MAFRACSWKLLGVGLQLKQLASCEKLSGGVAVEDFYHALFDSLPLPRHSPEFEAVEDRYSELLFDDPTSDAVVSAEVHVPSSDHPEAERPVLSVIEKFDDLLRNSAILFPSAVGWHKEHIGLGDMEIGVIPP